MKPILLSGTAAYSQFRLDALRAAMGALVPALANAEIQATWVYAIQPEGEGPDAETLSQAGTLLNAVGAEAALADGAFYVTPRKGTISPWSSKATDIFRNCGLKGIARVERGIRFSIAPAVPVKALSALYDKMTEGVYDTLDDLFDCPPPKPGRTFEVLE